MKNTILLTLVSVFSLSAHAGVGDIGSAGDQIVTKCRLYNPPNDSVAIPATGEQKFELNGLLVEVKETLGCAAECFTLKEISVTKNGVTFSSKAESKEREILFPSLSIAEKGNTQTVQCMLTKAQ